MGKKQIAQEIIDWSNSDEVSKTIYRWKESKTLPQAADNFYNLLQAYDENEDKGLHLPSGVCYHESEVDDRDDFHIVFSVTNSAGNKKFYKLSGFYSSWDGISWEEAELSRVYPEVITVTKYSTEKPA
jgi:hypothetical protein